MYRFQVKWRRRAPDAHDPARAEKKEKKPAKLSNMYILFLLILNLYRYILFKFELKQQYKFRIEGHISSFVKNVLLPPCHIKWFKFVQIFNMRRREHMSLMYSSNQWSTLDQAKKRTELLAYSTVYTRARV